ncbi:DUF5681 domain-containing protein [Ferrovibrio sp.]|uniref:DUF5681 domain-containing protein n=1 Tax=Ferrovibrio sp. TaxID=1917215 RepID=UPI0035B30E7C
MAEPAQKKDTKFKPGQVANPKGRPKGSRNKLGEDFLRELCADFAEHGRAAIEAVREKKPEVYMKVVADLLPKQIEVTNPVDGISDDELIAIIGELESRLAATQGGAAGSAEPQQVKGVSPLH